MKVHRLAKTVTTGLRTRAERGSPRLPWAVGWCLAAVWALAFPLVSHLTTHQVWGLSAGVGYGCAAVAVARLPWPRARTVALGCALAGAVLVPLAYLVLTGAQQSEVGVIERAAELTLRQGTPYQEDPREITDYNPYLPAMALLGLPRALLGTDQGTTGLLGDARLWCALVLLLCLAVGRRVLRAPGAARAVGDGRLPYRAALVALVASPPVALPLCASGVDLPLTGLCALALACAARGRPVATGLALAVASALKWTAWPAVAVAVALLGWTRGRRTAVRCLVTATAGTLLLVLPAALLSPRAMVEQVLAFPTGLADVATPAASPLPGHLLAEQGPIGRCAAVALLLLGALAVGAWLLLRPPTGLAGAAQRLAMGLCVGFLLAPAGRFGYLALPIVLVVWARQVEPTPPPRTARRAAAPGALAAGGSAPPPRQPGGSWTPCTPREPRTPWEPNTAAADPGGPGGPGDPRAPGDLGVPAAVGVTSAGVGR